MGPLLPERDGGHGRTERSPGPPSRKRGGLGGLLMTVTVVLSGGTLSAPANAPQEVRDLLESLGSSWAAFASSERSTLMKKIHDQLSGGAAALSTTYHPDFPGLKEEHQKEVRRARRHVNLAKAALDRLVNSIHAGRITRRSTNEDLQRLANTKRHRKAMRQLCENAFAYGTGSLVPVASKDSRTVKYWFPNPRFTLMATDPMDVDDLQGIVEVVPGPVGTPIGFRAVTKSFRGTWTAQGGAGKFDETALGFVPAVVAYGRDMRHMGQIYGESLIEAAADGSIDVTNNELNLKILRDRFTRALLLVFGEPTNSKEETRESLMQFIQFLHKDKGDAKFITPDSRIADVIELTKRFCTDAAVGQGLPLDTFLPETVTGSDASATAARNRAFPLQQRMVRMTIDWEEAEESAMAIIGALRGAAGRTVDDLVDELGITTQIQPSLPEAETETLANWIQKTEKFLAPIEDAVEYYSGHLPPEQKEALVSRWRTKFDPSNTKGEIFQYHVEGGAVTVNEVRQRLGLPTSEWGNVTFPELAAKAKDAGSAEASTQFKREIVRALFGDATMNDVMVNLTKLGDLVAQTGLPRESGYEEPWMPVVGDNKQPVTGGTVTDTEGRIVGGETEGSKAGPNSHSEEDHDGEAGARIEARPGERGDLREPGERGNGGPGGGKDDVRDDGKRADDDGEGDDGRGGGASVPGS
jgi:hypothetical protein